MGSFLWVWDMSGSIVSLELGLCESVHHQLVISFGVHAGRGAVQSHFEEVIVVMVARLEIGEVLLRCLNPGSGCSKQPLVC